LLTFTAVAVNRSMAPLGADNFYATVTDGFYNDSAFFRVVPGFVVQFGISGSKAEVRCPFPHSLSCSFSSRERRT